MRSPVSLEILAKITVPFSHSRNLSRVKDINMSASYAWREQTDKFFRPRNATVEAVPLPEFSVADVSEARNTFLTATKSTS